MQQIPQVAVEVQVEDSNTVRLRCLQEHGEGGGRLWSKLRD